MTHELKTGGDRGYLRIATEEAFATQEQLDGYLRLVREGKADRGTTSLWGFYASSPSERTTLIRERLLDLGERRIADMDATGIDIAILSLTAPGVQVFEAEEAKAMVVRANDQLAEAVSRHPDRFVGMTSVAPQDPAWSAHEIARGEGARLQGRDGEQPHQGRISGRSQVRSDPARLRRGRSNALHPPAIAARFDDRADGRGGARRRDLRLRRRGRPAPLATASPAASSTAIRACRSRSAIWARRLPFWLFRLDYMHRATVRSKRYDRIRPLEKTIFDYMRENVYITTSGMAWEPAIKFSQEVLGVDRVLYAMDYPYQFEADEVRTHDNLAISDADKKKLMQTNAERAFKL